MRKKILILSCRFQTYSVLNLAPFSSISDLIVRPIVNLHFLDNYNISCCTPDYNLYGFFGDGGQSRKSTKHPTFCSDVARKTT